MAKDDELEHSKIIGKIEAEVHTLNTLVKTLFKKFDDYVEKSQPKAIGPVGYIGITLSILSILALIFGTIIYMTNSANAPIVTSLNQITQTQIAMQNSTMLNANQNQLTRIELSGLAKSVGSNEETLRWMIFTENLPKQITQQDGRLNTLEMQVNRIVERLHNKGK